MYFSIQSMGQLEQWSRFSVFANTLHNILFGSADSKNEAIYSKLLYN